MGASPTPMAFGEVYTSLQTGVIDGYEHDASTTLQQRFYEIARHMARTRHIAGVLGLWASTAGSLDFPSGMRDDDRAGALEAARISARWGRTRMRSASEELDEARHDDPRDRRPLRSGRRPSGSGRRRRAPSASSPGSGRSAGDRAAARDRTRLLDGRALPAVVDRPCSSSRRRSSSGSRSIGRHVMHQPIPWTEEIARLLLVWLMCIGGIAALRQRAASARHRALVRLLSAAAARARSSVVCGSCSARSSSASSFRLTG